MSKIRNRAREQLPMVLLTLLSIVQALALELLWSKILASDYLFEPGWAAMLGWIQAASSFAGIVVIWLVYASTAMRFRWVPSNSDSIYPFIIGVCEFVMIEMQVTELMGWWFVALAAIFALMTWVNHSKMRRARRDGDNDEYFSAFLPATQRDFLPTYGIIVFLLAAGIYLGLSGDRGILALLALLTAASLVLRQVFVTARFWNVSVA